MALQMMSLRRGALMGASAMRTKALGNPLAAATTTSSRWFASGKDVGDVIGIDLGTTNSCVAVMVGSCWLLQSGSNRKEEIVSCIGFPS